MCICAIPKQFSQKEELPSEKQGGGKGKKTMHLVGARWAEAGKLPGQRQGRNPEIPPEPKKKEEDSKTPNFLPRSDIFTLSLLLDVKMLNI